jgi:hypothetical protein
MAEGKNRTTQCQRLKRYLEEFHSITPLQALRDMGIMRLGARVWDLEHNGWKGRIRHDTIPIKNRWNQTVRVSRYSLIPEGQQVLEL